LDSELGWFHERVVRHPETPALTGASCLPTYGDLAERILALERTMRADGLRRGSAVVAAPARAASAPLDWVVALLAIVDAGGQAVVPDPEWSPAQTARLAEPLRPVGSVSASAEVTIERTRAAGSARGAPGIWLFTSGTTAEPEPRFRPAPALEAMLARVAARFPHTPPGRPVRSLGMLPLHHGFGLLNGLLLTLWLGGTLRLAQGATAGEAWQVIEEEGIDVIYGWPANFAALAGAPVRSKKSLLRWCVSSSSPLDPAIAARFADLTGCPVRQQYGTTETGPLCLDSGVEPVSGCVGTPLDGIAVRVVEADGERVGPGESGDVAIRSTDGTLPVLSGADDDGWFFTGDVGYTDDSGRLFLAGRRRRLTDERADLLEQV
jgi:acyl-CoA synthetase (AMP-forming)/AMP-acid ligase II